MPGVRISALLLAPTTELAPAQYERPEPIAYSRPLLSTFSSPLLIFKTCLRVISFRGSVSGDRDSGSQSNPRGSSKSNRPESTNIPIKVDAMLFAVDQVRVRVDISKPSAYRSCIIWPLYTTNRLTVCCSSDGLSNAQFEAAPSASESTLAGSVFSEIKSPSGQGISEGLPGGYGSVNSGKRSISSKSWSGGIITQPIPSLNAALITGTSPGAPISTAFFSLSTR